MEGAVFFITSFGTLFGFVYLFLTTRHKERLALIEKGADANLFYSEKSKQSSNWSWAKFTLKIGMFLMGIALGIFFAVLLSKADFVGRREQPAIYFSLIFFFGGLSLLLYYIFMDRKSK